MADLFSNYEEDFRDYKHQLEQKIRNIPQCEGAEKRNEIQAAEDLLKELDGTLKQMNLSARANARLMGKMKECEQDVARMKGDLRRASMQFSQTADRGDLFAGLRVNTDKVMAASMDSRERLLSGNERLTALDNDIDHSIRIANEAVDTGARTLEELDVQTGKLKEMKEKTLGIEETLGKAKRIMNTMARRAWMNKIILFIIALVLVAAIAIIVYVKYFSGSSSSSGEGTTTGETSTTVYATTQGTSGGSLTTGVTP